ncbi:hypothetical protein NEUTE2DRAFT_127965 [Neurospora tetrasperma FGSC 2509]|nr:hypothetical protein NEUTE2DRAFT_127965 [Neurospora tetrasperma FGSC 2509]
MLPATAGVAGLPCHGTVRAGMAPHGCGNKNRKKEKFTKSRKSNIPSYALCPTSNAIKLPFTALTAFVPSSLPRFPRHVLRSDLSDSSPQFLQVNARDDILGDTCSARNTESFVQP